MDPPAGAGGHGDPAAVGELGVPDRGHARLVERGVPAGAAFGERTPGDGGDAGRDVAPAFGLRGGEAALPASAREPSERAAHTATVQAPSGARACCSKESATAWASAAASAPLSAVRSRTTAEEAVREPPRMPGPPSVASARNSAATSESRSRAAWLMTSTASSRGSTPACSARAVRCRAASTGPRPSRSIRMPRARSSRARPSAAACAAHTSCRSRRTVAASRPTAVRAVSPPVSPASSASGGAEPLAGSAAPTSETPSAVAPSCGDGAGAAAGTRDTAPGTTAPAVATSAGECPRCRARACGPEGTAPRAGPPAGTGRAGGVWSLGRAPRLAGRRGPCGGRGRCGHRPGPQPVSQRRTRAISSPASTGLVT